MTRNEPANGREIVERRSTAPVLLAVLLVLVIHVLTSWGYVGLYWGDPGRWLYEVDRFTHGAKIYRDVYWGFPPLGMWVVGGAARVIGSDLAQIWTITTSLAVLIGVAYALVVAQLLRIRLAVLVGATGMALGTVYSSAFSAPLVSGSYTPAVPVAVLIAFSQLAVFLRDWTRPSTAGALTIGVLGGAGILAKHDVWLACTLLAMASAFVTPTGGESRPRRVAAALGGFIAVAGSGIALLAIEYGVRELGPILSGHGQVQELRGLNYPNLGQATVELTALGIFLLAVASIAWLSGARRSKGALQLGAIAGALALTAAAVWFFKTETITRQALAGASAESPSSALRALAPPVPLAMGWFRHGILTLREELIRRPIPIGVPLLLLVIAFIRRRTVEPHRWRMLVVLLLVILCLRARRLLSFDEWFALMLEVPVYVYALWTLWPLSRQQLYRAVGAGCGVLLIGALYAHWWFGFGVMSRRGSFPWIETARGSVRLSSNHAATYRRVRDYSMLIDSTGTRPLLAFGYSAGHNYLLGRPGVGSLTHGFRMSLYPTPDSAYRVAQSEHDRLILVDNTAFATAVPVARLEPWRWAPRMRENHYKRIDRPLFERLKQGCRQVTPPDERASISVYDCAPAVIDGAKP
jgi:hypothetical protein